MADDLRPTHYGARKELSAEQIGNSLLGISRSLISEAERLRSNAIEDLLAKHFEQIIQSMKGGFEDLMIYQKEHEVTLREQRAQFAATDTNVNTTLSAIRMLVEGQTKTLQQAVNQHMALLQNTQRTLVWNGWALAGVNLGILGAFTFHLGRLSHLW